MNTIRYTARGASPGAPRRMSLPRSSICAALCGAVAANAAESLSATQPIGQVEEVIVTAQRRAESLQQVPIAISALTAEVLEQRQLSGIAAASQFAPNVQFSAGAAGSGASANFFIRGIGQVDFITTTDPGVGVYLDGVYLARVTGAALDLADVDRIEVLRGPQGTLFGRNTIGGAINVVTAAPTSSWSGKANALIGNLGRADLRASLSGPVTDRLGMRLAVMSRNSDGYGTAVQPNGATTRLGEEKDVAGRLTLAYEASDRWDLSLSTDFTRKRGTVLPQGMVDFVHTPSTAAFNAYSPVPIGPQWIISQPDRVMLSAALHDDLDVFGIALTSEWRFDELALKSITAYRSQSQQLGQDFDGSPAQFLDQIIDGSQRQFSQEFQITVNAFDGRLHGVGGLYYFTERARFDTDGLVSLVPAEIYTSNGADSYAAFGQATWSLTDKLAVTGGLRATREKKLLDVNTVIGGFDAVPPTHRNATSSAVTPKLALEYQMAPESLLYASVSRGFRSGGFNGRPFAPPDLTYFEPEEVTVYEIGSKNDLLDHRLRLNTAVFYSDYKDIQVTATTTSSTGQFIVSTGNAGVARVYGAELELQAKATRGLDLFASAGYMHNTLKEKPGFTFGARELPNAPEWSLAGGGEYRWIAGSRGSWLLGADATYRSGSFPGYNPAAASYIDSYYLLNAHMGFESERDWRVVAYGKNLSDRSYWVFAQTAGTRDVTQAWFGRPREYGLHASVSF